MIRYILLFAFLISAINSFACSMFTKTADGKTLVANNEDWKDPETIVWFEPAAEGEYGAVYLGFKNYFPQGGMNDQGLCFDGFATAPKPVMSSLDKPVYEGWLNTLVMETCSTIDEVIAVFDKYNLQSLESAMLMFVDRTGDSVIIEGDEYIRREGNSQIVTNFYQSEVRDGLTEPGVRYKNLAGQIWDADVSVKDFRSMLASVHQEGQYPTQYSNIFDPVALKLYLYHFHNYENELILDVSKELKQGEHTYDIPTLFPETFAYEIFKERYGNTFARKIAEIIDTDGTAAAEAAVEDILAVSTVNYRYPLDEFELNDLGYQYLARGQVDKAICVFKINVENFPESWNCFDSLGEAYLEAGNYEEARKNYLVSLELNPQNLHAEEVLEEIKNK